MNKSIQELIENYQSIQHKNTILEDSNGLGRLVTAESNKSVPVQRWFHFKESFSLCLLETLITQWKIDPSEVQRILDPFCGVGTTLLASQQLAQKYNFKDLEVVGIERNPFLRFAALTKSNWHNYDSKIVKTHIDQILTNKPRVYKKDIPQLSTFNNKMAFDRGVLKNAIKYRKSIEEIVGDYEEANVFRLGFASVIESISNLRKDGRALRFVTNKTKPKLEDALRLKWTQIAEDIDVANDSYTSIKSNAFLGDARKLQIDKEPNFELGEFDLIFYSPPYPNNIDYTEVYKLELWITQFVKTNAEFRAQRLKTFRSHPSIKFNHPITYLKDPKLESTKKSIEKIIDALPDDHNKNWRSELFNGYFDDMYQSLKAQMKLLKPGGWIFCVVGNSLHGPRDNANARVPIAADLLIAQIAESIGLKVEGIQIARHLTRRKPNYGLVRESIVVMRK